MTPLPRRPRPLPPLRLLVALAIAAVVLALLVLVAGRAEASDLQPSRSSTGFLELHLAESVTVTCAGAPTAPDCPPAPEQPTSGATLHEPVPRGYAAVIAASHGIDAGTHRSIRLVPLGDLYPDCPTCPDLPEPLVRLFPPDATKPWPSIREGQYVPGLVAQAIKAFGGRGGRSLVCYDPGRRARVQRKVTRATTECPPGQRETAARIVPSAGPAAVEPDVVRVCVEVGR